MQTLVAGVAGMSYVTGRAASCIATIILPLQAPLWRVDPVASAASLKMFHGIEHLWVRRFRLPVEEEKRPA
uniref:Uncharacterized protein n=1 Tax=Candidozyma auris TaxID=498019 RepID=A0A0L0P3H5_CANAR